MKSKDCTLHQTDFTYKINCISRNYKDVNGYNGRGNYNSALFYFNLLNSFKKLVLETFTSREHSHQLIREVFNHLEINHLESKSIKLRELGHVNIWFTQLLRHRPSSSFTHDNDILFTRNKKEEIGKGSKVTNGLSFSVKHNIDFYPKYYGKMYERNKLTKQALGIYLRPDVLPDQVNDIITYISDHRLDELYDITVLGPKETLGGYRIFKNALFTTDESTFIESCNIYLYSFASENDTINNTLYNCILNKKRIIYVMEPTKNDNVLNDLKVLFKDKNIYYTTKNVFSNERLNAITSSEIIDNSVIVIDLIKESSAYFIRDIMKRLNTELFIFTEKEMNLILTNLDYSIWYGKFKYIENYPTMDFERFIQIKQAELRRNNV